MLAALTQEPAFKYGEAQAEVIGTALSDVSRHYNMNIDGPVLSLFKLGAAVAFVNVPILGMINARRREARAARAAQPATPEDVVFSAGRDGTEQPQHYDFTGSHIQH